MQLAVTALVLLGPDAGLAVETQWRLDATVDFVYGSFSPYVAIGDPVKVLVVLDRDPPYVQIGNPCDGEALRIFHSVRATQLSMPGASGAGSTPVPPGVDCSPDGHCDLTVDLINVKDPPGCQPAFFQLAVDAGPLASPELGDLYLHVFFDPSLPLPAPAFYSTIPDAPWAMNTASGFIQGQLGNMQLYPVSLSRAQVCGDIDLDLDVDGADVALLRAALADPTGAPLPAGGPSRCSVIGDADDCDMRDVAVLRRTLAGGGLFGPAVQQVCASMNTG